jgi:transcriptional regulator of acetoin/glycerol metabolism
LGETLSAVDLRSRNDLPLVPRPQLFRVLDCDRPLSLPSRHGLHGVQRVIVGRGATTSVARVEGTLTLKLADPWASVAHAELRLTPEGWVLEDQGSKNGTLVNGAPAKRVVLEDGDLFEVGRNFFLFRDEVPTSPADLLDHHPSPADGVAAVLTTLLPELARHFVELMTVAPSQLSIVIRGETGTGKELVAQAVHALSARPGDFVPVNCAAIAPTLVESELFGHKKGAFTGALEDRAGLVRTSDHGTLFLDEIGDMGAVPQAALLRVLQEKQVLSVGANRPVDVDLRVCSATHRDVGALVREGKFREDLLARLSGFNLELPPVRERREDLGLFVRALILRLTKAGASQIRISPKAGRTLMLHSWPLNVRELEKSLERCLALATDGLIQEAHLPDEVRAGAAPPAALEDEDRQRRAQLEALLKEHGGNISAVARAMGKDRVQIRRWIKRFGL